MERACGERRVLAIVLSRDFELPVVAKRHRRAGSDRRACVMDTMRDGRSDEQVVTFFLMNENVRLVVEIGFHIGIVVEMIRHEIGHDGDVRAYRKIAESLELPRVEFEYRDIAPSHL